MPINEYQVAKMGTGEFLRRMTADEVSEFLRKKISKPNEIRLMELPGNDPGPVLPRLVAIARGESKLRQSKPGYKLAYLVDTGPTNWVVRTVRDDKPTDTDGTDSIDEIWTATYKRWDDTYNILNLGICANKPGQHLRCNAWDGGVGKPKTADAIHEAILRVGNWLRDQMLKDMSPEPGGLPVLGIIVMSQFCSRESPNWGTYHGTPHVSHWHVSGNPSMYPGWI